MHIRTRNPMHSRATHCLRLNVVHAASSETAAAALLLRPMPRLLQPTRTAARALLHTLNHQHSHNPQTHPHSSTAYANAHFPSASSPMLSGLEWRVTLGHVTDQSCCGHLLLSYGPSLQLSVHLSAHAAANPSIAFKCIFDAEETDDQVPFQGDSDDLPISSSSLEKSRRVEKLLERIFRHIVPQDETHVKVTVTILSSGKESPDLISSVINAVSMTLSISNLPYSTPVVATRVSRKSSKNSFALNPSTLELRDSILDILLVASPEKIFYLDAKCNRIPVENLISAVDYGLKHSHELWKKLEASARSAESKPTRTTPINLEDYVEPDLLTAAMRIVHVNLQNSKQQQGDNNLYTSAVDEQPQLQEVFSKLQVLFPFTDPGSLQRAASVALERSLRSQAILASRSEQRQSPDSARSRSISISPLNNSSIIGSCDFVLGSSSALSSVNVSFPHQVPSKASSTFVSPISWKLSSMTASELDNEADAAASVSFINHSFEPILPSFASFPLGMTVFSQLQVANGSAIPARICSASLALADAGIPIQDLTSAISCGIYHDPKLKPPYLLLLDPTAVEESYSNTQLTLSRSQDGIHAIQLVQKSSSGGIPASFLPKCLEQCFDGAGAVLDEMRLYITRSPSLDRLPLQWAFSKSNLSTAALSSFKEARKALWRDSGVACYRFNDSLLFIAKSRIDPSTVSKFRHIIDQSSQIQLFPGVASGNGAEINTSETLVDFENTWNLAADQQKADSDRPDYLSMDVLENKTQTIKRTPAEWPTVSHLFTETSKSSILTGKQKKIKKKKRLELLSMQRAPSLDFEARSIKPSNVTDVKISADQSLKEWNDAMSPIALSWPSKEVKQTPLEQQPLSVTVSNVAESGLESSPKESISETRSDDEYAKTIQENSSNEDKAEAIIELSSQDKQKDEAITTPTTAPSIDESKGEASKISKDISEEASVALTSEESESKGNVNLETTSSTNAISTPQSSVSSSSSSASSSTTSTDSSSSGSLSSMLIFALQGKDAKVIARTGARLPSPSTKPSASGISTASSSNSSTKKKESKMPLSQALASVIMPNPTENQK